MILNNSVGLVCILLIIISVVVYFKGHLQSKYYTLAMMLYLVSVVLFTFMIKGHFEYSLMTRYGFVIGIIIEMLLFSYLLANRYDLSKQSVQNYLEAEVKQQTKELNFLVEERELLLKEVFHRVKNNFHMLIAMLYLEKEKTQIDFIGLINRVKSMSMIHEYLYSNKNLSYIDINSYIENLIQNLQNSYPKVSITFESQNFALNFDHALSLGIIINEVLTNAIKHNPNNENIILHIQLYKKNSTNSVHLSIKDNGKEFKNQNSKGLGLKLINQFCKKLPNCQSSFSYDKGVKFELYFDIRGNLEKS
jgi:two-component sensor histidine kinase